MKLALLSLLLSPLVACVRQTGPAPGTPAPTPESAPGATTVSIRVRGPLYPMPENAQICRSGSTCNWDCDDGNCNFVCEQGSTCNVECDGGNCEVQGHGGATVNAECDGGNCKTGCDPGATCNFECDGGSCAQGCAPDTTCNVECDGGSCSAL